MTAALTFFAIYLFGVYAFFRHIQHAAIDVDDDGNPITAEIIAFPQEISRRRQTRRARV